MRLFRTPVEGPESAEDKSIDVVSCETCRCLLDKKDAYIVKAPLGDWHYCGAHIPPFHRVSYSFTMGGVFRYFKEVEVDKNGNPLKTEPKKGGRPRKKKRGRPRKETV